MPNLEKFLSESWQQLEDRWTGAHPWVSVQLPEDGSGRLPMIALDEAKHRHFLVPAGTGSYATNTHSPLSVTVDQHQFSFPDGTQRHERFVDISCQIPRLNRQFDLVIASIVDSIEGASDRARRAISTVGSWRRLFSTLASAPDLSHLQKMALFGEISILELLIIEDSSFSASSWTGPDREPHDFELSSVSLEVKTLGSMSANITINGLKQLALKDGKPLFLVIVEVEENSNGRNVGEILEDVVSLSESGPEFRRKCARAGVFATAEDSARFEISHLRIARVNSDFPRLTHDVLPVHLGPALGQVVYDLKLSEIDFYFNRISASDISEVLDAAS